MDRPGELALLPRGLQPELDILEAELRASYRPPAAIDRRPDFIWAIVALEEARAASPACVAPAPAPVPRVGGSPSFG